MIGHRLRDKEAGRGPITIKSLFKDMINSIIMLKGKCFSASKNDCDRLVCQSYCLLRRTSW